MYSNLPFGVIPQILLFKFDKALIDGFNKSHFLLGLIGTWIAGIGRYYDNDKASVLQKMGVGSVIYIFVLAFFIWLLLNPYKIRDVTYFKVLTFVSLTSFPAILYAIPVEKMMGMDYAIRANVWFLLVVALWRLILLWVFLYRFTLLKVRYVIGLTFLPMTVIITTLTILNLERAVFNIMGGISGNNANDGAYMVLTTLTWISILLLTPLLFLYFMGMDDKNKFRNFTSLNS